MENLKMRIESLLKKMKVRQLTKNEKVLLSILGVLIMVVGAYNFVIEPQAEKISFLNEEEMRYQAKIDEIHAIIKSEKKINEDWYYLNRDKDKIVAQYFPEIDQPQIIYLLNDLIGYKEVSAEDLYFTRTNYETLGGLEVENMGVSLPYSGEYTGVVDIVNSINESKRKILIENISMDKSEDGLLEGNINLKVYSLAGIAEGNKKHTIEIDTSVEENKLTPFSPYDGYIAREEGETDFDLDENSELDFFPYEDFDIGEGGESAASSSGGKDGTKGSISSSLVKSDPGEILLDFESRNNYFLPSQSLVKGNVSRSTNSKSKQYSLRLEYNILAMDDINRAYVDISKNEIEFKYPPKSIGLWVYSYDYSPVTVGAGFKGQMGEEEYISFTEGIDWTGWKYLELSPSGDINQYPLKLDKLYLEIPKNRDDFGVILMDKLEAIYPENTSEDELGIKIGDYIFHVVSRGETIEGISRAYYGNVGFKNEIMGLNEMKPGDILPVGKILVLKKR